MRYQRENLQAIYLSLSHPSFSSSPLKLSWNLRRETLPNLFSKATHYSANSCPAIKSGISACSASICHWFSKLEYYEELKKY